MSDTSGPTYLPLCATSDPDWSSSRTSPGTSPWALTGCCKTWPKRGSMRSGACYEHPTWAPPTVGSDCSLLLTPTATDGKNGVVRPGRAKGAGRTEEQLRMLPTPMSRDGEGRSAASPRVAAKRWDVGRRNLDDAVALLPMPTASQPGGTAEQMLARKATCRAGHAPL